MRALDKARLRLRSLTRRAEVDRELDEEFRSHLEQLVEENLAAGMPEAEARSAALRTIGGITPTPGGMPRYATDELYR
jgi:hypothetical protein